MVRNSDTPGQNWGAVARAVNRRLSELGWGQVDLVRESRVSDTTIRELQRGKKTAYQPRKLAAISRALGWPPDAIWRIANGEPAPADEPLPPDDLDLIDELDRIKVELDRRLDALRERIVQRHAE